MADKKKTKKTADGAVDRALHDPISDKLTPLEPLDLSKIKGIDDLVRAMGRTAFTARQVGRCRMSTPRSCATSLAESASR